MVVQVAVPSPVSPWNGALDTSEGRVSYTGVHHFVKYFGELENKGHCMWLSGHESGPFFREFAVVLARTFGVKLGFLNLAILLGNACCVTLVRSCFNHSLLPFQCISTCMFYSRWSHGTCLEITRFHSVFSDFALLHCIFRGLPQSWQHVLSCVFHYNDLWLRVRPQHSDIFTLEASLGFHRFFKSVLAVSHVNKVKRFQNFPFNTEGSAEFASWPFPGAQAIVPVRM